MSRGIDLTPAKQQSRLRWLVREFGAQLVGGALGLGPSTVAKFIAGVPVALKSRHAIDRGFRELGFSLGLEPPSRIGSVPSGAPRLVVIDGEQEGIDP